MAPFEAYMKNQRDLTILQRCVVKYQRTSIYLLIIVVAILTLDITQAVGMWR